MGTSNIRDYIQKIVGDNETLLFAEVTEVDGVFCTVQPIDETLAKIENVRLVAEESDAGFYPIPKVGSQVIVTLLGGTSAFISMFGELDSIALRGDQYGGLIKIEELVTKLNNLENKVNSIINTLNSTVIPLAPSGTYPLSSNFASVSTLTTTNKSDLENDKVLHG
jgi:tetrahydromethanopterin S-methyltransferase subunit B